MVRDREKISKKSYHGDYHRGMYTTVVRGCGLLTRSGRSGGKTSTSVKIEAWQQEWLAEHDHLNVSALYRDFLTELIQGGGQQPDGLEWRLEMKENELEEAKQKRERLETEIEELREKIEQREQREDPELEEAVELLSGETGPELDPSNPAIQTQASKVGLTPDELIEEVESRSKEAIADGQG